MKIVYLAIALIAGANSSAVDKSIDQLDVYSNFIKSDLDFSYLSERNADILSPTFQPDPDYFESSLAKLEESINAFETNLIEENPDLIEIELFKINLKLQETYTTLLKFAKFIISLDNHSIISITDALLENDDLFIDFDKFNSTSLDKRELEESIETSEILNMLKRKSMKLKLNAMVLIKMFKTKKLLKNKKTFIIWYIIRTIEKIKLLIRFIAKTIITKVKLLLTEFPPEAYWRIKLLVKFLLRKLFQIIYDLKFLFTDLTYKFALFIKFLVKIPISILMYFTTLQKKSLIYSMELKQEVKDDINYLEWENEDDLPNGFDFDDMNYQYSSEFSVSSLVLPQELEQLFEPILNQQDYNDVKKYSFNFDMEFVGEDNEFTRITKRSFDQVKVIVDNPINLTSLNELITKKIDINLFNATLNQSLPLNYNSSNINTNGSLFLYESSARSSFGYNLFNKLKPYLLQASKVLYHF